MNFATLDTGMCVPESRRTLELQQRQLLEGARCVQMFPLGTEELPIPDGVFRFQNDRGIFHFSPTRISQEAINAASSAGRENELLNLGPISKGEVAQRLLQGENLLCITEYTKDGIEVRSAAGTDQTIDRQREYFEATKDANSHIVVGDLAEVITERLRAK